MSWSKTSTTSYVPQLNPSQRTLATPDTELRKTSRVQFVVNVQVDILFAAGRFQPHIWKTNDAVSQFVVLDVKLREFRIIHQRWGHNFRVTRALSSTLIFSCWKFFLTTQTFLFNQQPCHNHTITEAVKRFLCSFKFHKAQ